MKLEEIERQLKAKLERARELAAACSVDEPVDKTQEELLSFIQTQPNIAKHLTGDISKVVYVPNKLISLVCDA